MLRLIVEDPKVLHANDKKLLSLITAFPGGTDVGGKEMPMDRNDFAAAGFYFVVPKI